MISATSTAITLPSSRDWYSPPVGNFEDGTRVPRPLLAVVDRVFGRTRAGKRLFSRPGVAKTPKVLRHPPPDAREIEEGTSDEKERRRDLAERASPQREWS